MIRRYRYLWLAPVIVIAICWAACTQQRQTCLTPKTVYLNLETQHLPIAGAIAFADTTLPYPVMIAYTSGGRDSFLYGPTANMAITMSSVSDSCVWAMKTDTLSAYTDTIVFYYDRNLHFISNACGYTYYFHINSLRTTHYAIDSVHISNSDITNDVKPKHVQIYIHPDY